MHTLARCDFQITFLLVCTSLIILGCNESNPANADSNDEKTVSYKPYVGQWEGKGPYHIKDNPWDADSIYVTNFEVTNASAAVGDSVGYFKLNNKVEYCWGAIFADEQQGGKKVVDFSEARHDSCGGGRGEFFLSYHTNEANEKVLKIEANPSGEIADQDPWYSATLHAK